MGEIIFHIFFELFWEVLLPFLGDFFFGKYREKKVPESTKTDYSEFIRLSEPDDAIEPQKDIVRTADSGYVMAVILLAWGGLTGFLISWIFPDRMIESIPVTGVSLLITPFIVGGVMSLWGTWKSDHDHPASFLASFRRGALFGFAAAATRFLAIIPE